MKVGDKLIAKEDFYIGWVEKGKTYWIKSLDTDHIFISEEMYFNKGYWFTFKPKKNYNDVYVWDYFYTPKELRKLKLDKLNETTLY